MVAVSGEDIVKRSGVILFTITIYVGEMPMAVAMRYPFIFCGACILTKLYLNISPDF